MKKLIKIILIVFIVALVLNSCKEPEEKTYYEYNPITPELKTFAFKKGSYWIYSDSTTSTLDTLTILQSVHDSLVVIAGHPAGGGMGVTERILGDYYSSLKKIEIIQTIKLGSLSQYIYSASLGNDGQGIYSSYFSIGDTSGGLEYKEALSSFTDNGNTYYNLKLFKIVANSQFYHLVNSNTTNYFCPNKGIVRYEVDSAGAVKVWKLIDSHLIPL